MVGDFGFLIRTIPFCLFFTTFFLLEMSDRYRPMNVNRFYGWCKHILILGAHFIWGLGCLGSSQFVLVLRLRSYRETLGVPINWLLQMEVGYLLGNVKYLKIGLSRPNSTLKSLPLIHSLKSAKAHFPVPIEGGFQGSSTAAIVLSSNFTGLFFSVLARWWCWGRR